jgi:hypothetical protein
MVPIAVTLWKVVAFVVGLVVVHWLAMLVFG